jgi:hypothetical protein
MTFGPSPQPPQAMGVTTSGALRKVAFFDSNYLSYLSVILIACEDGYVQALNPACKSVLGGRGRIWKALTYFSRSDLDISNKRGTASHGALGTKYCRYDNDCIRQYLCACRSQRRASRIVRITGRLRSYLVHRRPAQSGRRRSGRILACDVACCSVRSTLARRVPLRRGTYS